MATYIKIYYRKDGDSQSNAPLTHKIQVTEDKRILIKITDSGQIKVRDFDFRTSREGIANSPIGTSDGLYECEIIKDDMFAKIAARIPSGSPAFAMRDLHIETFPHNVFIATGEDESFEEPTEVPSWIPTASFTDNEKRDIAISAIKEIWRPQVKVWMLQAAERAVLSSNLIEKVGGWLKAADRALQIEFQSTETDMQTVAKMAELASQGAKDITDVDTFMLSVHLNSTIPTNPILWVSKVGPSRVDLADTIQYTENLPSNYNALDTSWLV